MVNPTGGIADTIVITVVSVLWPAADPAFSTGPDKSESMLKLSENPPIVFPVNSSVEDICGLWWVAHTKARNEKALAWCLAGWDIPYFLPLREKTTIRSGRRFKSLLPLFSGYLFFAGSSEQRLQALTTNRIAQVIEVVDQAGLVRQLSQIHRALDSGLSLDPHPRLKSGDGCRVTAGPLMGMEGIVVRKKSITRLLLEVEILGQAAAVEIDSELLEPIE